MILTTQYSRGFDKIPGIFMWYGKKDKFLSKWTGAFAFLDKDVYNISNLFIIIHRKNTKKPLIRQGYH